MKKKSRISLLLVFSVLIVLSTAGYGSDSSCVSSDGNWKLMHVVDGESVSINPSLEVDSIGAEVGWWNPFSRSFDYTAKYSDQGLHKIVFCSEEGLTESYILAVWGNWTNIERYNNGDPIIRPTSGWFDEGGLGSATVLFHDNKFYLFYEGIDKDDIHHRIGMAVSKDGINFQKICGSGEECSIIDQSFELDGNDVYTLMSPGVYSEKINDNFFMHTDSLVQGVNINYGSTVIAYSTSSNLYNWSVPKTLAGPSTKGASFPIIFDGLFYRYYQYPWHLTQIGVSISDNPTEWSRYNETGPILESNPDRTSTQQPNVVKVGDTLFMFYGAHNATYPNRKFGTIEGFQGYLAMSRDGINWIDYPYNPILRAHHTDSEWNQEVDYSAATFVNGMWYIYHDVYNGRMWNIGLSMLKPSGF